MAVKRKYGRMLNKTITRCGHLLQHKAEVKFALGNDGHDASSIVVPIYCPVCKFITYIPRDRVRSQ